MSPIIVKNEAKAGREAHLGVRLTVLPGIMETRQRDPDRHLSRAGNNVVNFDYRDNRDIRVRWDGVTERSNHPELDPPMPKTTDCVLLDPPDSWTEQPKADLLPRSRAGRIKRRLTFKDKLLLLDPSESTEVTQERLMAFMNLFAFRTTGGVITKASGGPRDWAALRAHISPEQVARHLLADRLLPIFRPQWVGSRSPSTTCRVTLDVDADRPRAPILSVDGVKEILAFGYRDLDAFARDREAARKRAEAKRPFADRCLQVEDALRRLGPDSNDPRQVLRQPTPSGGMHYTFFLTGPYFLGQINDLLLSAGLHHLPGQVEFFPSTNRALRLPFGHVPGGIHDPQGWIRFIDDFVNRRIRRFSLEEMHQNLLVNPGRDARRVGRTESRCPRETRSINARIASLGIPKARRDESRSPIAETDVEFYLRLVNSGCSSASEAQHLFDVGILVEGTRTLALKQLAAHLIWFRDCSADQAAEVLTTWSLNDRHQSKDIRADLSAGTDKVKKQIDQMCRWYAGERNANLTSIWGEDHPSACFAAEELEALAPAIQSLPVEERPGQAGFFLSFLTFAKRHGRPGDNRVGWEAAPAINAVVRKWDGCRGRSRYLTRMNVAVSAGLLVKVREKLQVPGGKGRARTYLLSVPVVDRSRWTITRAEALARLIAPPPQGRSAARQPAIPTDDREDDSNERSSDPIQSPGPPSNEASHKGSVHQGRPGGCLGSRPPCRPGESAPVEAVLDRGLETGPALSASKSPEPVLNPTRGTLPTRSTPSAVREILDSAGPALADDPSIGRILDECELPPRMRAVLAKPIRWLTPKEQRVVRHFLETRGRSSDGPPAPGVFRSRQGMTDHAKRFEGAGVVGWIPHPS